MWKSLSSAMSKFVAQSYEQANSTGKNNPFATQPELTLDRRVIDEQFQNAMQLMQAGNFPMAMATMRELVGRAEKLCQPGADAQTPPPQSSPPLQSPPKPSPFSALHAEACFKEAIILMSCKQPALAEITIRKATGTAATDDASQKARCNYLSYHGEILTKLSRFDDAVRVLHESVEVRKKVYGPEHPGYAVGHSVLAESLLAAGKLPEAQIAIDQAVKILSRARHERLPIDLALRAYIIKANQGIAAPALGNWTDLTVGMQKSLVHHAVSFARQFDPKLSQAVLTEIQPLIGHHPQFDANILLALDIALANSARQNGDAMLNVSVCKRMVERCRQAADRSRYVVSQQALAMALEDAGLNEQVPQAYDAALQAAREIGELTLLSTTLVNYAQWCDDAGQFDKAEMLYKEAAMHGASSGDWSTHGRSSVAYGTFLMHNNKLTQARALLEEAIAHLPPSHEDCDIARKHLDALDRGEKCDCERKVST